LGYGLDREIPHSGKRLVSSPEFPDRLWVPPSFYYSWGARGSFPRDKSTRVWGWPTPFGVEVNEWSNLRFQYAFMACTGQLYLTYSAYSSVAVLGLSLPGPASQLPQQQTVRSN